MRIAIALSFAIALSTLTGEAHAAPPPQTIPGCGSVADCVKKLAELVGQLSQENQEQAKRLATLEQHTAPPPQTVPGCGPVADCVKKLSELVSQMSQENQEQTKRLAALEHTTAPPQTMQGCGPMADCVKKLAELVRQLSQENQEQAKRLATLEHDAAVAHDAVKQLHDRRTSLVNQGGDRDFLQDTFWTGTGPSHVNYTCPERNVLVGMEFEMSSDGVGRHPSRIKLICRELNP